MKKYYIIGIRGSIPYVLARNGNMRTSLSLNTAGARSFATAMAAHNFIKKERAAGSNWDFAVLEVEE
jgi:hypothetical protein